MTAFLKGNKFRYWSFTIMDSGGTGEM